MIKTPTSELSMLSGANQFSSDRGGADFPRGVHGLATKELTEHCSYSTTVVA